MSSSQPRSSAFTDCHTEFDITYIEVYARGKLVTDDVTLASIGVWLQHIHVPVTPNPTTKQYALWQIEIKSVALRSSQNNALITVTPAFLPHQIATIDTSTTLFDMNNDYIRSIMRAITGQVPRDLGVGSGCYPIDCAYAYSTEKDFNVVFSFSQSDSDNTIYITVPANELVEPVDNADLRLANKYVVSPSSASTILLGDSVIRVLYLVLDMAQSIDNTDIFVQVYSEILVYVYKY
ncbi:hypothetical protein [Parasitella parasitica]|uniref:Peptidase A1 domain-containing protein n=1 Tax=Parasitella parasitica TaxID=35722 RepID=A0A0B7MPI3_9FUNG|nr:hypothetical protein [Parasitella parasitica]